MSAATLRLLRAAFACLAAGLTLGVTFALDRPLGAALRPMHAELNVWGFVSLLIYGVALHIVPRFAARPLRWPRLAAALSVAAPAGVAVAAAGWWAAWQRWPGARAALAAGGALEAAAAAAFIALMADLLWPRQGRYSLE